MLNVFKTALTLPNSWYHGYFGSDIRRSMSFSPASLNGLFPSISCFCHNAFSANKEFCTYVRNM